ncbi:hypothetical protein ACN28S_51130 [Cystobacter fuscus]
MSFLDSLSDYLQQVGQSSNDGVDASAEEGGVSPAFARNALIRCLERLEIQAASEGGTGSPGPDIAKTFEYWQENDAVVSFSNQMVRLLRESMGSAASKRNLSLWWRLRSPGKLGSKILFLVEFKQWSLTDCRE